MKKLASTILLCACLGASAIGTSAASPTEDPKEGGINLDPIMANYADYMETKTIKEPVKIFDSSITRASAGGGTFWVEWGRDRHYSNYNHPTKIHRSSASNSTNTKRSTWENPGDLASIWIKSSLTGNKANWATK